MKIDFLIADNLYSSTSYFAQAFSQALQRKGVQTRLLRIADGDFMDIIRRDPPTLTCSFSDIHFNGTPLGDLWQIPHLSLLIDPAIYSLHQLKGNYSWISCADLGDVDFIRALNFERVFHLPHGGDRALLTTPSKERPYEVVFFGTCCEHEPIDEHVLKAAERVLSPENVSILQSLIDLGIPDEKLAPYHIEVDLYTRFQDRIHLLRSLKHYDVHIWGEGPWEKYLPRATIHPPIPFGKTIEVMKEAKVVVNSSPRFKQGLHERILYGSLCGAAILSANGGGYTYCYGEWKEPSFTDWEEVARATQATVLAEHTWDHRAKTLLDYIKQRV